jgi:serine/threonine protein kinase
MLTDRYRIVENSGFSGGYGTVVPVVDAFLGRTVLLKYMQNQANNDQLINEIRTLSKARSRHVIDIYDVLKDPQGKMIGIIIEYLTGRGFTEFYSEGKNTVSDYITVLYQIVKAISDLHRAGVIHRDIKLNNMKESASGLLKLFDFGLSVDEQDYITKLNRGTFNYAAPELYIEKARIDYPMDIYSFGICAWALVVGEGQLPRALLTHPPLIDEVAPSINSLFSGRLHPELCGFIDACLSKEPSQRPTANCLEEIFSKHMNIGRHRGLFVQGDRKIYELSSVNKDVTITSGKLGSLRVDYDSLDFVISSVSGNVFINNSPATVGNRLYHSCLITFGSPSMGYHREYVTFSLSHPEVVL